MARRYYRVEYDATGATGNTFRAARLGVFRTRAQAEAYRDALLERGIRLPTPAIITFRSTLRLA